MKPSRRNQANAIAKAEKRQGGAPVSKYAAKLAKERQAMRDRDD